MLCGDFDSLAESHAKSLLVGAISGLDRSREKEKTTPFGVNSMRSQVSY